MFARVDVTALQEWPVTNERASVAVILRCWRAVRLCCAKSSCRPKSGLPGQHERVYHWWRHDCWCTVIGTAISEKYYTTRGGCRPGGGLHATRVVGQHTTAPKPTDRTHLNNDLWSQDKIVNTSSPAALPGPWCTHAPALLYLSHSWEAKAGAMTRLIQTLRNITAHKQLLPSLLKHRDPPQHEHIQLDTMRSGGREELAHLRARPVPRPDVGRQKVHLQAGVPDSSSCNWHWNGA